MAGKRTRSKKVAPSSSSKRTKGGSRLEEEEEKKEEVAAFVNDDSSVGCRSKEESSSPSIEVTFSISPRENDFTERSWWLVDIDCEAATTSQGATALVKRCMRVYNWDIEKARKILKAYWQFLTLKKELKDWDATLLSPSLLVDQMWHQHILDVVNYNYDMMLLCGHIIGHNPDGAALDEQQAKAHRDERTRNALKDRFFGEYDAEIWSSSPPATTTKASRDDPENNLVTLEEEQQQPNRDNDNDNDNDNDVLTLRFVRNTKDGTEVTLVKLNKHTKMSLALRTICEQKGLDPPRMRFLDRAGGGERIGMDDNYTPLTYGLEDGDQIDFYEEQTGC